MGYKRDDPTTYRSKNIPRHRYGGLFDQSATHNLQKKTITDHLSFSFSHSQFVWDCKSEPGVRSIFAQIWGTDKLTVSFGVALYPPLMRNVTDSSLDGGTLAIPTPDEADHGKEPWPHVSGIGSKYSDAY